MNLSDDPDVFRKTETHEIPKLSIANITDDNSCDTAKPVQKRKRPLKGTNPRVASLFQCNISENLRFAKCCIKVQSTAPSFSNHSFFLIVKHAMAITFIFRIIDLCLEFFTHAFIFRFIFCTAGTESTALTQTISNLFNDCLIAV